MQFAAVIDGGAGAHRGAERAEIPQGVGTPVPQSKAQTDTAAVGVQRRFQTERPGGERAFLPGQIGVEHFGGGRVARAGAAALGKGYAAEHIGVVLVNEHGGQMPAKCAAAPIAAAAALRKYRFVGGIKSDFCPADGAVFFPDHGKQGGGVESVGPALDAEYLPGVVYGDPLQIGLPGAGQFADAF